MTSSSTRHPTRLLVFIAALPFLVTGQAAAQDSLDWIKNKPASGWRADDVVRSETLRDTNLLVVPFPDYDKTVWQAEQRMVFRFGVDRLRITRRGVDELYPIRYGGPGFSFVEQRGRLGGDNVTGDANTYVVARKLVGTYVIYRDFYPAGQNTKTFAIAIARPLTNEQADRFAELLGTKASIDAREDGQARQSMLQAIDAAVNAAGPDQPSQLINSFELEQADTSEGIYYGDYKAQEGMFPGDDLGEKIANDLLAFSELSSLFQAYH